MRKWVREAVGERERKKELKRARGREREPSPASLFKAHMYRIPCQTNYYAVDW